MKSGFSGSIAFVAFAALSACGRSNPSTPPDTAQPKQIEAPVSLSKLPPSHAADLSGDNKRRWRLHDIEDFKKLEPGFADKDSFETTEAYRRRMAAAQTSVSALPVVAFDIPTYLVNWSYNADTETLTFDPAASLPIDVTNNPLIPEAKRLEGMQVWAVRHFQFDPDVDPKQHWFTNALLSRPCGTKLAFHYTAEKAKSAITGKHVPDIGAVVTGRVSGSSGNPWLTVDGLAVDGPTEAVLLSFVVEQVRFYDKISGQLISRHSCAK